MIRPELLIDEILRRAETVALDPPLEFTAYARAAAFAELRGWSAGKVTMYRRDGVWRVADAGKPCGCSQQDEVRRG